MKISINGIELEAVTVPGGAKDFIIGTSYAALSWNNYEGTIRLPPGEYEPLGICNQIPEEVAAGIVDDPVIIASHYYYYMNYNRKDWATFSYDEDPMSAQESLCSLIESHGMIPGFIYLLKKKNKMKQKGTIKFDRLTFHTRWKQKRWARNSTWVIVGIQERWASVEDFSYNICFFGFDISIWFKRTFKTICDENNEDVGCC